jgi:hypothetical protein
MSGRRRFRVAVLIALLLMGLSGLACTTVQQRPTQAASDTLVKVVILSRHGVRSPIPDQADLDTWTTRREKWPTWVCPTDKDPNKICDRGQLTQRGAALAGQAEWRQLAEWEQPRQFVLAI